MADSYESQNNSTKGGVKNQRAKPNRKIEICRLYSDTGKPGNFSRSRGEQL